MTNIEIPLPDEKPRHYRVMEMVPGITSWTILVLPALLGWLAPIVAVYLLIAYLLIWFMKGISLNIRVLEGWREMQKHQKLPWRAMLEELETGQINSNAKRPKWHRRNIDHQKDHPPQFKPSQIIQAVMIASYNEGIDVLEPTVQAVLDSDYDMKQVILILAYEARDGAQSEPAVQEIVKKYGPRFKHVLTSKHPLTLNEVRGKGGNITYAGRELEKYLKKEKIDPMHVLVTTLDADNRPHAQYFGALSYTYAVSPDPLRTAYQPVSMYTQNIWDAPAPMRVIATGNSIWMLAVCMRPHALRNFSAHSQPMAALIKTNYWSVRTIVEDGHQFWRSYFTFDGHYEVYPIMVPIYQDAVFAGTYRRTLRAQFVQLRRWAYGASDVAYVTEMSIFRKNKINRGNLIAKWWRLFEGHISWSTAPLLILGAAFIPAFLNPNSYVATQLPVTASRIELVAMAFIFVSFFLSFKALPPKPARYKRRRTVFMVVQWILLPVTTIVYTGLSGLNAQTRLLFGRYLAKFDVTEKAVAHDD